MDVRYFVSLTDAQERFKLFFISLNSTSFLFSFSVNSRNTFLSANLCMYKCLV